MNDIITEIIELQDESPIIKVDGEELGTIYLLGSENEKQRRLKQSFERIIAGEPNPDIHKSYALSWVTIGTFVIILHHSTKEDDRDLFPNFKTQFIKLRDILRGRMGVAYYYKSGRLRLQVNDTRYYKIVLSFDDLYRGIIKCLKLIPSINIVDSIESFDNLIGKHSFYRGHSSYTYKLIPSLLRGEVKNKENNLFKDFVQYSPQDVTDGKNEFELLALMQHYGIPTRLLDITLDKYVALFMACTTAFGDEKGITDIGKVVSIDSIEVVRSDSEIITQLSRLSAGEKCDNVDFSKLRKSYCIEYEPSKDNPRQEKQKGTFIMYGLDEECSFDTDYVYIINKESILKELDYMGYNEMTLIPELEHICHFIKQKHS